MWRKPESQEPQEAPTVPSPRHESRAAAGGAPSAGERAVIGPSISIRGDVTGEEDLLIQGKVDGKVDLEQNNVTIGERGRVNADVFGRSLTVEGRVEGNLYGSERVVVRSTGHVTGNITCPRVTLEDGATFKGSIDMDAKSQRRDRSSSSASAASSPSPGGAHKADRPKAAAG